MRRPSLATVASYGTVVTTTATEGTLQFLIPPYLEDAGYPISLIGFLYALPFAIALLCRVPAGLLYRGSRARRLVAAGAVASAVTAILYLHAPGPLAFGLLRTVHGVALAVTTTVTLAHFLGTHHAARGRAMGYYATALSAGYMLGNSSGGVLADRWGYPGAFAGAALIALLGALLAGALPPVAAASPPPAAAGGGHRARARRALTDPGLVYTAVVAFLVALLFHVPGTFFPLYALGVGLGLGEIGFIRGAFAFTNTAVRGLSGIVLERVGRRQALAVGLVCQAAALALLPAFHTLVPLLALLLLVAFWRAVALVANTIGLAEDPDPVRVSRGVAAGVYSAANDLGGLVAPSAGGLIAAAIGLDNLFRVLPGAAVVTYFAVTAVLRPGGQPTAPAGVAAERAAEGQQAEGPRGGTGEASFPPLPPARPPP